MEADGEALGSTLEIVGQGAWNPLTRMTVVTLGCGNNLEQADLTGSIFDFMDVMHLRGSGEKTNSVTYTAWV